MKTIFLTIFQGVEAKNILRTTVLAELLKEPDIRLVFFVRTPERAAYYRREFSDPRIVYEVADFDPVEFWDKFFGALKFLLLRTKTTDLRRRMELDRHRKFTAYQFVKILNWLLARPWVRHIVRWLDYRMVEERRFAPFFERYRPQAVLLAHLFGDEEVALLREARRRGVATVGFVNSWDKLTARSTLRLHPDLLLAYNDIVKAEAVAQADMAPARIAVVGIPQYDRYVGYQSVPRDRFLAKVGLRGKRRVILYAPMGETFSNSDWDIIDLLQRWIGEGAFGEDAGLLVRFQPNDRLNEAELKKRPWLRYDRPGIRFQATRGVDWDMSEEELEHLADTLSHVSLLACYASSMSVDAAIFDTPVVNIGFEVKPVRRLLESPTQFYRMAHYQNALASGGIRLVRSEAELRGEIRRYLDDPSLDREGRARLVREQCGALDGKAGERIAERLLYAATARRSNERMRT